MNEKNAKNAALIRHLQNISIAALALSAIFLLMQTPLIRQTDASQMCTISSVGRAPDS